jgi:hypothetical protein
MGSSAENHHAIDNHRNIHTVSYVLEFGTTFNGLLVHLTGDRLKEQRRTICFGYMQSPCASGHLALTFCTAHAQSIAVTQSKKT